MRRTKKLMMLMKTSFLEYDVLSLLEKDVKHYYEQRFITVIDKQVNNISTLKSVYPQSLKNNFSDNDLQKLTDKLLWIKVVFPSAMQLEFFEEIQIYTNAFPVMNRQVNDLKFRLKGRQQYHSFENRHHRPISFL
jgi:hypothetical protein